MNHDIDLSNINVDHLFNNSDKPFAKELQDLKKETGATTIKMPVGSVVKLQKDIVCFDFSGVNAYPEWMETKLVKPLPSVSNVITTIISVVATICPIFHVSNPNTAICAIEKTNMNFGVEQYIKSFIKCFITAFNNEVYMQGATTYEDPTAIEYMREQQSVIYFGLNDFDEIIGGIPNVNDLLKTRLTDGLNRVLNTTKPDMFKTYLMQLLGKITELNNIMSRCLKMMSNEETYKECIKDSSLAGESVQYKKLTIYDAVTWLIQTWTYSILPMVKKLEVEKRKEEANWMEKMFGNSKSSDPSTSDSEFADLLAVPLQPPSNPAVPLHNPVPSSNPSKPLPPTPSDWMDKLFLPTQNNPSPSPSTNSPFDDLLSNSPPPTDWSSSVKPIKDLGWGGRRTKRTRRKQSRRKQSRRKRMQSRRKLMQSNRMQSRRKRMQSNRMQSKRKRSS